MISLDSLAAFSANGSTTPAGQAQAASAAASVSGVQRARVQATSPAGTTQTPPKPLPGTPDKPLPRGSLLNLQV